ncbi:MAG: C-terminal helicase domain-containing protein [Myxococcota bacterium]
MLTDAERKAYDQARTAAVAELSGPSTDGRGRFAALAALTRLRQLACHPRLVDPASELPSSKLARLMTLVRDLRTTKQRALLFSQFTQHLALVREALDEAGFGYLYLDGQTPAEERARRVEAFQEGDIGLFLISLKAGGTGLTLTGADTVIHLDPWWNPAVEDQATDRAHRIGQTKPVTVYRLVARATIEEAIVQLHESKRELVAQVLGGTQTASNLSTDELIDLIRTGG